MSIIITKDGKQIEFSLLVAKGKESMYEFKLVRPNSFGTNIGKKIEMCLNKNQGGSMK